MATPAYRTAAASRPVLLSEPVEVPAPETSRLGLPLIPDDADNWGDDYRRAMVYLDAHPGIAIYDDGQRPPNPFPDQIILERQSHRLLQFADGSWVTLTAEAGVGPQGPPGPAGAPGTVELVYTQSVADTDWWIPHAFTRKPDVTTYDAEGDQIHGQVSTSTPGFVHVSFGVPMTGSAVLD